jgi:Ca-activated chloride channel family protein
MKRLWLLVFVLYVASMHLQAQSGVLLPLSADTPNPAVLSLQEMRVNIVIDGEDARVFVTQIFANHTDTIQEGTYVFALPSESTVSDFAVWDGPVRIPAVILERKRAEELYAQALSEAIDPGLLEAGERAGSNPSDDSTFTAKITPIPAYGTQRLELEYHQRLTVHRFAQSFVFPLRPAENQQQSAARLNIHFELHSAIPLINFQLAGKAFPLQFTRQDAQTVIGAWEGTDVPFDNDLSATWNLDPHAADTLVLSTFRDPHAPAPSPDETGAQPAKPAPASEPETKPEPGFFLAQTLVAPPPAAPAQTAGPRTVVLLLDTSLSMQWDKLERSYAALEAVLLSLKPADRFSLLLFNQDVSAFQPQPVAATPQSVQQALQFVKSSRLRGGTDLGKALSAGLAQAGAPHADLYLFTDGGSDRGASVLTRTIAVRYAQQWRASARPHINIFAVGDDANLPLLRLLAQNDGLLTNVLSTEPIQPKLDNFLAESTSQPVAGLHLDISPNSSVRAVYPLDDSIYAGSLAEWVGQYPAPAPHVTFTAHADREGKLLDASATVDLPAQALDHPQLPRLWAQARVDALLAQIARDGETRDVIDEIIQLSRRYKFVTPYTSFLAVPRSLLRPRVIRPGDPVLRVHTDPAIVSVIALFPFGLTQPLRHLPSEDIRSGPDSDRLWETRFLAPTDMQDGTYAVRLILRDLQGNTYSEQKTFVIDSTPPRVRIHLDHARFQRGDLMQLKVEATATTRTLTARLQGAMPVDLRWSGADAASTGALRIPDTLAPGTYTLSVTAEDIAHNVGSQEVPIEVVP